jgi:hypothetical protein
MIPQALIAAIFVGLKRVLKKCICCQIREIPGLKPIEFAGFFAGLKPCAPTEKQLHRLFQHPLKPHASTEKNFGCANLVFIEDV